MATPHRLTRARSKANSVASPTTQINPPTTPAKTPGRKSRTSGSTSGGNVATVPAAEPVKTPTKRPRAQAGNTVPPDVPFNAAALQALQSASLDVTPTVTAAAYPALHTTSLFKESIDSGVESDADADDTYSDWSGLKSGSSPPGLAILSDNEGTGDHSAIVSDDDAWDGLDASPPPDVEKLDAPSPAPGSDADGSALGQDAGDVHVGTPVLESYISSLQHPYSHVPDQALITFKDEIFLARSTPYEHNVQSFFVKCLEGPVFYHGHRFRQFTGILPEAFEWNGQRRVITSGAEQALFVGLFRIQYSALVKDDDGKHYVSVVPFDECWDLKANIYYKLLQLGIESRAISQNSDGAVHFSTVSHFVKNVGDVPGIKFQAAPPANGGASAAGGSSQGNERSASSSPRKTSTPRAGSNAKDLRAQYPVPTFRLPKKARNGAFPTFIGDGAWEACDDVGFRDVALIGFDLRVFHPDQEKKRAMFLHGLHFVAVVASESDAVANQNN